MKIEILGTRGKIEPSAPHYQNYSGILIDDRILIDIGEKKYLGKNPKLIVFTHFHPDHAYFMFNKEEFTPDIPLFGPEENEFIPGLQVIDDAFSLYGYDFTPVPVIHALSLKSFGYLIEKDEKKLFITGDVAWIEKANFESFPQVDLVITEASFINKGGRINRKGDRIFGHTGVPNLIQLLKPVTKKIAFTHYGSWYFEDIKAGKKQIKQLSDDMELICCHDGMQIEI